MKIRIQSLGVIASALITFALQPIAHAVNPPPDGCYSNFTTAEGCDALNSLSTGQGNTAIGWRSLFDNSIGNYNTGIGSGALALNNADSNTAVGAAALLLNTIGTQNTAVGTDALVFNVSGTFNTATGAFALFSNTASNNTATGALALSSNTSGGGNTATGASALSSNAEGAQNAADGSGALAFNTSGDFNTATGSAALAQNADGDGNTANGFGALSHNTTGSDNTAVGRSALENNEIGFGNTAVGVVAGSNLTTANNVICIGHPGQDVSGTTWIGNTYGVTTQSGTTAPVIISDSGQLGTIASSERFKKDIATMDKTSEAILSLRPVTFHYKTDTKGTSQFGLIAEEVAKANPALVLPDRDGRPYTVRYDAVNAMLLNEFLKEHREVEELKSAMAQQRKDFEVATTQQQKTTEALVARLNEQEARIQKVSGQLETGNAVRSTLAQNP